MENREQVELSQWIEKRLGIVNAPFDSAAAMQVLEKCFEMYEPISFYKLLNDGRYSVKCDTNQDTGIEKPIHIIADTLPLAIALFAKQLFTK